MTTTYNHANGEASFYVNGQPVSTVVDQTAIATSTDADDFVIGSDVADLAYTRVDGRIDEARVSAVVRSPDWIAAQYLSMTDQFLAYSSEEALP